MKRTPVRSSNIAAIGFEESVAILEIEFHSGAVYQYTGVPVNIYDALMSAPSIGSYFHQNIKSVYPYKKL